MNEQSNNSNNRSVRNTTNGNLEAKMMKENINKKKTEEINVRKPRRYNPVNNDMHELETVNKNDNQLPTNGINSQNNSAFANKNIGDFQNDDNLSFQDNNDLKPSDNMEYQEENAIDDLKDDNSIDQVDNDDVNNQNINDNNIEYDNNITPQGRRESNNNALNNNNINNTNNINQQGRKNANQNDDLVPKRRVSNKLNTDPTQRKLDRINNQKKQNQEVSKDDTKANTTNNVNQNTNTPKTKGSSPESGKSKSKSNSGNVASKVAGGLGKAAQIKNALDNSDDENGGVGEKAKQVAKEQAKTYVKQKIRQKIIAFLTNVILPVLPYILIAIVIIFFLLLLIFAVMGVFDEEDNVINTIKLNYCDHVNLKWGEDSSQNVTVSANDYIKYKINSSEFKIIDDENALIPLVIVLRTNLYANSDSMQGDTCYLEVDKPYTEESNELLDEVLNKTKNKVFSVSETVLSEIDIDEHFTYRTISNNNYKLYQDKMSYNKDWVDVHIESKNITNDYGTTKTNSYSPFAAWYLAVNNEYSPLSLIFHFVTPGYYKGNIYKVVKLTSSGYDEDGNYVGHCSDISLSETPLSRQEFIDKVNSYNSSYKDFALFKTNAGKIYDISKNNSFNPEMVVIRAELEGYSPGVNYNYWGIGCPNGQKCGKGGQFSSFDEGVLGYIKTVQNINSESLFEMQKKYSYIGAYWFNTSETNNENMGLGGCYYFPHIRKYMSEDRASEVENACQSGKWCYNGGKGDCLPTTDEDQNAYTRWQIEKSLNARVSIFGISVDECSEEEGPHEDVPASELGAAVAEYAVKTYDSWQYSQDSNLRHQNGYVDCSSMVSRAYAHFNVKIYDSADSTEGIYKWCENNGKVISGSSLAAGDLIFYNTGDHHKSNHYKGIGHVELYIGNNQRFGAHKHYSDHPADDVSIKSYNGGGNLFCRPSSQ